MKTESVNGGAEGVEEVKRTPGRSTFAKRALESKPFFHCLWLFGVVS